MLVGIRPIAGLLAKRAIVWVGPPLLAREPSSAAVMAEESPVPAFSHDVSTPALWPLSVGRVPAHESPKTLAATVKVLKL